MFKKVLLTAAISLAFSTGYSQQPVESAPEQQNATEEVAALPNGQAEVTNPEWADSKEVNTVEESPIAHKMTQAEKARNAKENDSWGGAITIIAMSIVLGCLIVLSVLFLIFGKVFSSVMSRKKREAHGVTTSDAVSEEHDLDSGEAIAAIAMALSEHFSGRHDIEDTKLTIRRMRKAYSPWNSKIYNMRPELELRHNKR